jgi:hypothetical protein
MLIILSFAPLLLGAQNLQLSSQLSFGSFDWDELIDIIETPDGGYLLCGISNGQATGDKTSPTFGTQGDPDIWVLKIDNSGTILWQKTYGGSSAEIMSSIYPTHDGNFIIASASNSNNIGEGNKTAPRIGGFDFWILKIDPIGDIIWQETYGGSFEEEENQVLLNTDGGFIVSTDSQSDISGNRQLPLKGTKDIWVLFLDSNGTYQKELAFGGSQFNSGAGLSRNQNTLFISGVSDSPQSIDKSEDSYGETDYWVLKTDLDGNVLADKTIGGSKSDAAMGHVTDFEGNIIVYGWSKSIPSGNKTAPWRGGADYWLVKLDTNLNIIWDKSFGGSNDDKPWLSSNSGIHSLYHNMTLISGNSSSSNGDKTSPNYGQDDFWVIGVDKDGNKVLEFSMGGTEEEAAKGIYENSTHQIMVYGRSESDVSGNKTTTSQGGNDFWMVTLDLLLNVTKVENAELNVFPNPTSSVLNFSIPFPNQEVKIELVDILGRKHFRSISNGKNAGQVDVTRFSSGTYFLNISGDNFQFSRQIIIQ